MNSATPGLFAVIFLVGAMLLAPTLLTGITSADNSSMNPSFVQLLDNQHGYRWTGTSQSRPDNGWQAQYRYVGMSQGSGNCGRCAVGDYDRDASGRDCDRCSLCPCVIGYHCDLYRCYWQRDYDCGSCVVK